MSFDFAKKYIVKPAQKEKVIFVLVDENSFKRILLSLLHYKKVSQKKCFGQNVYKISIELTGQLLYYINALF